MFYTFKNARITVDGKDLIAESVNISHSSSVDPYYEQGDRYNSNYVLTNGQKGSFQVSYYLTGEDFLKEYINTDSASFSGNFGGLHFESGYLESYSFQSAPNSPVVITVNGTFFDKIKGTFSPTYDSISKNSNFYNHSDSTITAIGSEIGSLSEVETYSYSVQNSITPVYYQNSFVPDRIHFDRRRTEMSISFSELISDLGLTGQNGGASIVFNHPDGGALGSYSCSGKMVSKSYSTSVGSKIRSEIRIFSEFYQESPTLTSISPTASSLTVGYSFLANGTNLLETRRISLADREVTDFTVLSNSQISGVIPNDAITGDLTVFTNGGSASIGFPFTDLGITVSSVSPSSGVAGQSFTISGNGFYRISDVKLVQVGQEKNCSYEVLSNSIINATVPSNYGGYDLTTAVYSSGEGRGVQLDDLTNSFNILPTIRSFTNSGLPNDNFIVRTYGHKGFDKIVFNNGPSYDTASSSGWDYLTGLVPEGNTFGKIRLYNTTDNVYVESTESFYPTINPTGISPSSGQAGTLCSLTGQNFYTGLLYETRSDHYLIDWNGVTGEMLWLSNSGLSGLVPEMTNSGPVRLYRNDGAIYENSINFNYVPPTINATGVSPLSGHAYNENKVKLLGANLQYANSISLTKLDSPNSGSGYGIVTGSGYGVGVGLLGNTVSFFTSGGYYMPTGNYLITVSDPYNSDSYFPYTIHNDNSITGYLHILAFNSQTNQYETFDGDNLGVASGFGLKIGESDFFTAYTSSDGTGWQSLTGIEANNVNIYNDSIYNIQVRKNTGNLVSKTISPTEYYKIRGLSNTNEIEIKRSDSSSSVLSFVWEWEKNGYV